MKNIAILGSSGGNLYNLGGKDPEKLLTEIFIQCDSADIHIRAVQFIGAEVSMDAAKKHSKAGLYTLQATKPTKIFEGILKEVNDKAASIDSGIAKDIRNGKIDGLITMSIDPEGSNKEAILAAAEKKDSCCWDGWYVDGYHGFKRGKCNLNIWYNGDNKSHKGGLLCIFFK